MKSILNESLIKEVSFNKISNLSQYNNKLFSFLILLFFCNSMIAQDPIFSQYYNAPLQMNPAFAGNTFAPTIHLNSRIEWPSIDFAYKTNSFSVDRFFHDYNFGAGLLVSMDDSGNGIYKRFRLEGITSYRLKINDQKFIKMGIGIAYGQNSLDWNKLVFGDMIDPVSGYQLPDGISLPTDEIRPDNLTINYIDLSAGVLFYSKELFFGIGVKHANTPVNYYFDKERNVNSGLPVRFTAQIGGEIELGSNNIYSKSFYAPSILFVNQSGLNQLVFNNYIDLGAIFAGIGYRFNFVNSDAVLFSVGVSKQLFKISYSYDYTISQLGIGSGGSHEIGISINFDKSSLFEAPYRYSDCFNMFR